MRGMDKHVCGSIEGRGVHYGIKYIKKWMKNDIRGTKWCLQMDIKQFYPSINPKYIIARFKSLIKDSKTLDLIERILTDGVLIGSYCSQWFANTLLQPLDSLIRRFKPNHYIRYADNFTIFASNKKILRKLRKICHSWLEVRGLKIKSDWQIFKSKACHRA